MWVYVHLRRFACMLLCTVCGCFETFVVLICVGVEMVSVCLPICSVLEYGWVCMYVCLSVCCHLCGWGLVSCLSIVICMSRGWGMFICVLVTCVDELFFLPSCLLAEMQAAFKCLSVCFSYALLGEIGPPLSVYSKVLAVTHSSTLVTNDSCVFIRMRLLSCA